MLSGSVAKKNSGNNLTYYVNHLSSVKFALHLKLRWLLMLGGLKHANLAPCAQLCVHEIKRSKILPHIYKGHPGTVLTINNGAWQSEWHCIHIITVSWTITPLLLLLPLHWMSRLMLMYLAQYGASLTAHDATRSLLKDLFVHTKMNLIGGKLLTLYQKKLFKPLRVKFIQ